MLADDNPYAAPQTVLTVLTRPLPSDNNPARFPWALVQQSLRNGVVAGLVASLVMMSVYLVRIQSDSSGAFSNLLATCGSFILVTSLLGLFWGFNHALIVWCLRHWSPETWMDD
jgi:hypothetical protein